MNAVNLLPPDLRRGPGAPGRSGLGVYVVLGVLAAAVLLASMTALLERAKNDRAAEVARVEAEAVAAEQRAATLTKYKELAQQAATKVAGVRGVAAGRVDWARTLNEVSRTVGSQVAFASVNASATPGVSAGAGGGNPLRSAIQSPAIEVVGCARDNAAVARMMARFRAMTRVKRVTLSSADKGDGAASASGGDSASDCRAGGKLPSQFNVVIFLDQKVTPSTATATQAATPAPAASTAGGK